MNTAVHIAVLDDEAEITTLLANYLQGQGFRVSQAHDGATLLRLMAADPPQLVLLDLGLPGEDGFSIARQLREHWQCGLVIVSGRGDSIDKVVGLEVGADDYVTKPFGMDELLARVRAAVRRSVPDQLPAPVVTDAFTIDLAARQVTREGTEVRLTPTEWRLLESLVSRPGRLVPQRQLLSDGWGPGYVAETNYLRVYVAGLRRKLEPDPSRPRYLITEPGMGYRFVP